MNTNSNNWRVARCAPTILAQTLKGEEFFTQASTSMRVQSVLVNDRTVEMAAPVAITLTSGDGRKADFPVKVVAGKQRREVIGVGPRRFCRITTWIISLNGKSMDWTEKVFVYQPLEADMTTPKGPAGTFMLVTSKSVYPPAPRIQLAFDPQFIEEMQARIAARKAAEEAAAQTATDPTPDPAPAEAGTPIDPEDEHLSTRSRNILAANRITTYEMLEEALETDAKINGAGKVAMGDFRVAIDKWQKKAGKSKTAKRSKK